MTNDKPEPTARVRTRLPLVMSAVLAVGAIGYGAVTMLGNRSDAALPCSNAVSLAQKLAPLARGEVAALTMATKPLQMPDLAFQDASGSPKKLSDWKGRTVLLNLWATWCVPCRKEMPALDNLQGKLGGADFEVVAVNIDTRDPEKPKAFLRDGNLGRLGFFADSKAKVFQDLKTVGLALGMPTSVIIDGDGCEIATIAGPAEWDSADAVALLTAAKSK